LPDSFATYSATLLVDRRLRAGVLGSGVVFLAAGVAVITGLPLAPALRACTIAAWSAGLAYELWYTAQAFRSTLAVVIYPDGGLELLRADDSRASGRLATGSMPLARYAWLRVAVPGRRSWGEPFDSRTQDREQWRRFQVICRHLSA
jgi:hypothetical protein